MSRRSEYRPSAPAAIRAENDGERWTLVFTRELRHAPEKVWEALTDPAQLREWAPFDTDGDLSTSREVTLTTAGADEQSRATIQRAERARLLEYNWDTDLLRWELEPLASGGTRLTLRHSMTDQSWLARVTAGWHICIDVLDALLGGTPVGRIVGHDARGHWEPLNQHYANELGIEKSGWPLGEG